MSPAKPEYPYPLQPPEQPAGRGDPSQGRCLNPARSRQRQIPFVKHSAPTAHTGLSKRHVYPPAHQCGNKSKRFSVPSKILLYILAVNTGATSVFCTGSSASPSPKLTAKASSTSLSCRS